MPACGSTSTLGRLRAARANCSSTAAPAMMSTDSQPSFLNCWPSALVLASFICASSITTSLPSACFAESALLRPSRRTFFCRSKPWSRTTGPKITAPPRNCGERRLPWRARPVPFWRQGFLVVPWMSLMPFVAWVPARRLASCQFTTRARMSRRTGAPNTASGRSISPTSLLSRFLTETFISLASRLGSLGRRFRRGGLGLGGLERGRERQLRVLRELPALGRIADQHEAALVAGDCALDQDDAALGVGGDYLEVLRGDPGRPHVARHALVLEDLAGILALTGRAVAPVRDRDAVGRAQAAEVVPLHDALEAAADADAGHVHELAGDEMLHRDLGPDLEERVLVDPEFHDLPLRLDLGFREMAALRLGGVLGLAGSDAELDRVVLVLLLGAHGNDLTVVDLEHGHGHVVAVRVEHAGHPELLRDETGTHRRLSCSA